jgi:hypothetical protein
MLNARLSAFRFVGGTYSPSPGLYLCSSFLMLRSIQETIHSWISNPRDPVRLFFAILNDIDK